MSVLIEKFINFNGQKLPYAKSDKVSETALVFIPGWGGNRSLHYDVAKMFAFDYKVIVAEFPGFQDASLDIPYQLSEVVALIKALLDAEDVERCVLLGHSMGGAIALELAVMYPQLVVQVVGIDSFTYTGIYPRQQPEYVDEFITMLGADFDQGKQLLIDSFYNEFTRPSSKPAIEQTVAVVEPEIGLSLIRQCLEWDLLHSLSRYPGPVRAIVAKPAFDADAFYKLCGECIEVVTIDECSHFISLDKPEALAAAIAEIL